MSGRSSIAAVALGLAGLLVLPAGAAGSTAQARRAGQAAPIAFPPGLWEGSILFSGSYHTEGVRGDGSSYVSERTVTASGINFQLLVDTRGRVSEGTMEVDIAWGDENSGSNPGTGTPYRITNEHRQTGTLTMTGTAGRLSGAGTLSWDSQTYDSDGDLIEEVSGVESVGVEWVFSASEANCASVTGKLVEASGFSLVASALAPRAIFEEDMESSNELVALLWAWPTVDDPQVLADAVAEIADLADEALAGIPTVEELLALVEEVEALRLEFARLTRCQTVLPGFPPQATDTWLAGVLRTALVKALDLGEYTAQELIALLNIGVRGQALDGALYQRFGNALGQALDNAVEAGDVATIADIATAAGRYGYTDVYADAVAALAASGQSP